MDEDRPQTLYDRDFYSWTRQQAEKLRHRDLADADLDHIAEEIETLGRSEAAALRSSLRLIVMHLLKMRHQPSRITRSWHVPIARERITIDRLLADSPGLNPRLADLFREACDDARREGIAETGLAPAVFPIDPAFTLDQVRDDAFLP